ncbi:flavin containing amine oxidoreductase [Grosmannia clavigera kw1407]|uniref:Flavin containing amine oxidoreductase n=1 Tax=Grosmannia clavigera (strain kw1407 / UAMH 11150) TaxID=655863 RepID=F0XGA6_GROCL|nr:flavin containing amine oxidoreductase [Grosmannia clavigera kw1407]EFX03191.1 flavin containing amine oxidoreductase [Grosmannia clavigera kw1407]
MDTYAVFSCSSARRDASRLVQDLKSIRRSSMVASDRPAIRSQPIHSADGPHAKPHIGVVGAGIAGLRCADILLQYGFRVTILEGRNRLGGRLHQQRLSNGHLVDMGPNWIHGTKDNPILDLIRETGTITSGNAIDDHGKELEGAVFSENGAMLPPDDGAALSTLMWTIVEEAFVHSNKHCTEIDPAESLHDFFLKRLPEHVPESTADCETRRALVMQMADLWGAFVGSPANTQSLKYFWLEECIEGGEFSSLLNPFTFSADSS